MSDNKISKSETVEYKSMNDPKTQEEEEEEKGKCGFCLFMKGGDCKETFVEWEKCLDEAEKNKEDVVEKCFKATAALSACMQAHQDYYEPILKAEKDADEVATRELERESAEEREEAEGDVSSSKG